MNQKKNVYLEVIFKRVPVNEDTFCKVIGPLPKPISDLNEMQICLFVRDLMPSKRMKDRELDLNTTRDHYMRLLEDAKVPKQILANLTILPMRELMTEYTSYQARNKLAASFDMFLVDWKLVNNKFKFLRRFLGGAFNERVKKIPIPVKFSETETLGKSFIKALHSTNFFISGHGNSSTILIGQVDYELNDLAKNLKYVVKKLAKDYSEVISILRICGSKSEGFPFFADFRRQSVDEFKSKFPLTKRRKVRVKIDDQFAGIGSEEEISDAELETRDGQTEIVRKKVRYEDISIF